MTRGSAPERCWGHRPQTRIIGSRSRAHHVSPNWSPLSCRDPTWGFISSFPICALRTPPWKIREQSPGVREQTKTNTLLGSSGLVMEYRTPNFQVKGSNLTRIICTQPLTRSFFRSCIFSRSLRMTTSLYGLFDTGRKEVCLISKLHLYLTRWCSGRALD